VLLDTPICDFGWIAPEFTLEDAYGKSFTMSSHLKEGGLLVAFICNHCPYVKRIASKLADDTKLLMDRGIGILAVMSNDYLSYKEDSPENMKRFSKEFDFTFPYLIDKDQLVAKEYGAVCTPDFFGFNSKGELQYRGRLDNRSTSSSDRVPELVNAMLDIAKTGYGPKEQFPSMGCSIKWRSQ
jgi:peroxiredoxin